MMFILYCYFITELDMRFHGTVISLHDKKTGRLTAVH